MAGVVATSNPRSVVEVVEVMEGVEGVEASERSVSLFRLGSLTLTTLKMGLMADLGADLGACPGLGG
jgi:hypothetical protein